LDDESHSKRIDCIFIDILTANGRPMTTKLAPTLVEKLWKSLGQKLSNIRKFQCVLIPRLGCRMKFKLHQPMHLQSLSENEFFDFYEKLPDSITQNYDLKPIVFQVRIHTPIQNEE